MTTPTTLAAFRASRIEIADLAAHFNDDVFEDGARGYVYDGDAYIEIYGPEDYGLTLANVARRDTGAEALASMEADLYAWCAVECGEDMGFSADQIAAICESRNLSDETEALTADAIARGCDIGCAALFGYFLSTLPADHRNVSPDLHESPLYDLIEDGADNEAEQRAALGDFLLIRDGGTGWGAHDYADALNTLFDEMDTKADAVRAACVAQATKERDSWNAIAERPDGSLQDAATAAYFADLVEDMEKLL